MRRRVRRKIRSRKRSIDIPSPSIGTREKLKTDPAFIEEFDQVLKDYVGRANPLYFAERLSERYKKPDGSMPHIYFKRKI